MILNEHLEVLSMLEVPARFSNIQGEYLLYNDIISVINYVI